MATRGSLRMSLFYAAFFSLLGVEFPFLVGLVAGAGSQPNEIGFVSLVAQFGKRSRDPGRPGCRPPWTPVDYAGLGGGWSGGGCVVDNSQWPSEFYPLSLRSKLRSCL